MAVKEELIKALIIQYDESIRLQSKLLDCGFAEALLNVIPINMKNREALEALLHKRTNECERLKKYLESACDKVSKLFAKHEENTHLKKFLEFAYSLSTFRDFDEDIDDESNSEAENLLQFYGCDISLNDKISEESNRNNSASKEHESEGVGLQFYEMTINLMSKLSIGNERNPDVSDEISSKSVQKPTSTSAELFNSMITSSKPHFDCDTCGNCFLKRRSIILHVREHMEKIQSFHCTKCSKSFPMKNSKENLIKCPICDMHDIEKADEEKNTLQIVALEEEGNGKSQKTDDFSGKNQSGISSLCCDICGKTYSSKQSRDQHIRQIHRGEKPYECTECGKQFAQKIHLKQHTLMHNRKSPTRSQSEVSRWCCNICSRKFTSKATLGKHIRQIHLGEKPYGCNECGKQFAQKSHLKKHTFAYNGKCTKIDHFPKRSRSETSNWCCDICGKKLSNGSNLRVHKRVVHSGEKPYGCIECSQRFTTNTMLKDHTRQTHGLQKPLECSVGIRFPCEHCNKGYWYRASLMNHLRDKHEDQSHEKIHEQIVLEEDARFQCAHCDRRFDIKKNLFSHIHTKHFPQSHKQFKCTICNKSFPLKRSLDSHKLTHTWRKPLKCSDCNRYFKYRHNKFDHEKKVHGKGVRFPCEHCGKGYWHEAFLIRHVKKHHA